MCGVAPFLRDLTRAFGPEVPECTPSKTSLPTCVRIPAPELPKLTRLGSDARPCTDPVAPSLTPVGAPHDNTAW
eukprot:4235370-Amphidinium_carterae.2